MKANNYNEAMNNPLRKTVRPKAHAAPRENASYRTFGSIYSRGKYHIFFEHFPFGLYSSHRYVGHCESDDLVFWKAKAIAIYSTKENDMDGAYEGSVLEDEKGLTLFFMGINYTVRDEEDINSYVRGTPVKTNLMWVHSVDITGSDFDNVHQKKTVLTDAQFQKLGFASGSVKDPEAYQTDPSTRYITFLALEKKSDRQAVGFIKGTKGKDGNYSYEYVGKKIFSEQGVELRTLRFFKSEEHDLFVMEANFPAFSMERTKLPSFKVSLGKGTIDFERQEIHLDEASIVPFDHGYDTRAPKVAYDTRNLPYVMCAMTMKHDIKGERGMVTLPRRIAIDKNDGLILTFIHPLITQRMLYKSKEQKVRQTHFPLLITATLKDNSSMNVGKLGIYRTNGVLHVDRRAIMDVYDPHHIRVEVSKMKVTKPSTRLRIFLDQDIAEIEVDEEKTISFITFGDDTSINCSAVEDFATYTMNPTKV